MSIKVAIVSNEIIKPSSPTPDHLKTFNLSLFDQYALSVPMSAILFYPGDGAELKVERLKSSLSEILTQFYPLAGRICNNQFIDCNDEGINFYEAKVNADLDHFVSNPIPEELDMLVPKDKFMGPGPNVLLSVQVNIFECGGMAVVPCTSHKIIDAASKAVFLNTWAATARGDEDVDPPKFELSARFPPKDIMPLMPPGGPPKHRIANKRLIFNASSIDALKAKASNKLYVEHPSRVEAISALIWKCAMKAISMGRASGKSSSAVLLPVNLRGKLDPPLSKSSIGNPLIATLATSNTEDEPELDFLVGQFRSAVSKVDSDYVRKLQDGGISEAFDSLKDVGIQSFKGEVDLFVLSSICRLPFYEVDFGWGKPTWKTSVNLFTPNNIRLMDTRTGGGVEAWVSLREENMARFESDPELIAFTSNN